MKILLVGDYSGVHHMLYLALKEMGLRVDFISGGDGNKAIPVDKVWLKSNKYESFFSKNTNVIRGISGYDIVQIINPLMVDTDCGADSSDNLKIFDQVKSENGKIFLYSCGDDYAWVSQCILNPSHKSMFKNPHLWRSREIWHPLRYLVNPVTRRLCKRIYREVDGIIPSSVDYDWCVNAALHKKSSIIPFPVDLSLFKFRPVHKARSYSIMHGVQKGKAIRKGDYFLESAASLASKKFSYHKISGVPYSKYLTMVSECDVFFDQVYAFDQGMSALFAMASGKVVFSGYSQRFYEEYKLETTVGIDSAPDVNKLLRSLDRLSSGDLCVEEISSSAREFVENFHDHRIVAEQFLQQWRS